MIEDIPKNAHICCYRTTIKPLLTPVEAKRSGVVAYLVVAVVDLEARRKLRTRFTKARAHKAKKASLSPLR